MLITDIVGLVLVAGLVVFLMGAGAWRIAYEQPLAISLKLIHQDRQRRAWIHVWMIAGTFITTAGVGGVVLLVDDRAAAIAAMAAVVYALGAVCWVASLTFRLTVVPWAAEHTVEQDRTPPEFLPLNAWAGVLYVVHMAASYSAFALMGAAVLLAGALPAWVGWLGVGWGAAFLAGFAATRAAGPFNPPLWAHVYTAVVGVMLLLS